MYAVDHRGKSPLEDTTCTLQQLTDHGVAPAVVEMVDALTHRPNEPQATYLARRTATPAAILVKRADISHNSHPDRLYAASTPTPLAVLDAAT